jgi:hypothetical protein
MALIFKTVYNNGVLDVYRDDIHIIHQPYHPDPNGSFQTEELALQWWESVKNCHTPTEELQNDIVEEPSSSI